MNPLSRSQLTISICMFFRHPDLWPVIWDPPLPTSNGFMLNVFAYATDPCHGLLPSSSAFGEFLLTLQNSSLRVTCSGEHSTTCVSKFPSSSNSLAFRDTPRNTEQNGQLSGSWIQTQVWRHQSRCPSLILACAGALFPSILFPGIEFLRLESVSFIIARPASMLCVEALRLGDGSSRHRTRVPLLPRPHRKHRSRYLSPSPAKPSSASSLRPSKWSLLIGIWFSVYSFSMYKLNYLEH